MRRALLLALIVLVPTLASAGTYDIDANGFYTLDGTRLVPDGDSFGKVMAEMGVAAGPKMIGSAHTLGILGFDIGYTVALTNIRESSAYWKKGSTRASNFLPSMQINLTKGLPFSFQIEGLITHLFESEVWGVGLNVKWAALEGYRYLPEISLSSNISTLMGTQNYTLLTFGGALLLSKRFGVGGILELNPYVGYHALGGRGASEVLYHFVGNDPKTFVIDPVFFVRHLGVMGITVRGGVVLGGFEAMLTGGLQTFSFKAGVTF